MSASGLKIALYRQGELAASNADQVGKIRRIVEDLSLTVATPDEARERLALMATRQISRPAKDRLRFKGGQDGYKTADQW